MSIRWKIGFGIVLLFAIAAIAACGGSPEPGEEGNGEPESQASNPSSSSEDACEAFAGLGGLGAAGALANFSSAVQGGPSVNAQYSQSAPSDEAGEIAEFFEGALEAALDGSVSAECFWEVSSTEQGGDSGRAIWVSLELPRNPSSEDVQAIQNELNSRGASVGTFFGGQASGEQGSMIFVTEIPTSLEGETGGMLMMQEEFAILIASNTLDTSSQQAQATPIAQSSTVAPAAPTPTAPTPVPQVADTSEIGDTIQQEIENALGFDVEVETSLSSSSGGQSSYVAGFKLPEGSTIPGDVADRFEEIATDAGATITAKIAIQGTVIVNFEGMEIGGVTANGSIAMAQDQNSVLVTFQY